MASDFVRPTSRPPRAGIPCRTPNLHSETGISGRKGGVARMRSNNPAGWILGLMGSTGMALVVAVGLPPIGGGAPATPARALPAGTPSASPSAAPGRPAPEGVLDP